MYVQSISLASVDVSNPHSPVDQFPNQHHPLAQIHSTKHLDTLLPRTINQKGKQVDQSGHCFTAATLVAHACSLSVLQQAREWFDYLRM